MQEYVTQSIKPLVDEHPEVGEILNQYGVGCVQCTIGTCRLEEVVKVHGLSPEENAAMIAQIERAIMPLAGAARAPTRPGAPRDDRVQALSYSPPVRRLVDEHAWIKRVLARIPDMVSEMRAGGKLDSALLLDLLDFIRGYADGFHHMKEEDILFDYADRNAEIVRVMLQDHAHARRLVRSIARALEAGELERVLSSLSSYRDLLTEHIAKEDGALYPYIDRGLTTWQVGELFRRFDDAERDLAHRVPDRFLRFVVALEARYGSA